MRETLREMAERHVLEGEAHIARQREIIAWRKSKGYCAAEARELLAVYEKNQARRWDCLRLIKRVDALCEAPWLTRPDDGQT